MPMQRMPLRVFVKGSKSDRKKATFCRDLHHKSKPQLICQYAKGGFKELPFRGSHPKHTVCTIGPVYHVYLYPHGVCGSVDVLWARRWSLLLWNIWRLNVDILCRCDLLLLLVCLVRLLKANRIPIRAISSLHLSEFGFNRVASIYLHKKFVFPDKVLAFLLQCSRSNPGEWLDPTQKKHVALYWKPSFDVLLRLLKVHNLLHVDLS